MLELGALAVEREGIRLGRGNFRVGACHVQLGDVSGPPAALGERERLAVRDNGTAHQRPLGVERAQREIGLRHFGLYQKARALQQPFARLRVEPRGVARLPQPPEEVDLVGKIEARAEEAPRRSADAVHDAASALGARGCVDLRRPRGVGRAHEGARLREAGRRDADAGVAAVGALDQFVEHWVGESLPPFAARLRFGRGGDGKAAAFPERLGHFRQGGRVDLRQGCGAAGEQREQENGCQSHDASSSMGAAGSGLMPPPPAKASAS